MKNTLTTLILFCYCILAFGQSSKIYKDKVHRFKFGTEVTECDFQGNPYLLLEDEDDERTIPKIMIAQKGWEFEIDKILDDKIIITFINWTSIWR
ncbi:hypothetical protein [uncultured Winogradskyella sp.]|uniref:hypothetical protein n=1 Tax=uncultured Winogradskyella sp. TaxID=395353 RepID=UPI00261E02AA|nr:hypothetical protein [uncultured Winogradskyella sp.]